MLSLQKIYTFHTKKGMNTMKRKLSSCILILILVLSFASTSLATTVFAYSTEGSCKKAYTTTGYLWKGDSQTWDSYMIYPGTVSYANASGTYAVVPVRAVGLDGTSYSSKQDATLHSFTSFTPYSVGTTAEKVKFKIHNAYYDKDGISTTTLTFAANCYGGV